VTLRACLIVVWCVAAMPCAAQTPSPSPADSTAVQGTAPAADASSPGISPPAPAEPQAPVAPPSPPDFPRGKISGYVFGDAYFNATGDPTHSYTATGGDAGQTNIDATKPITRDLNGVQLRRVYFQLDNDLSVRYATRLRLETDGKALSSDGKISAFVKNAYFQARSVIPRADFLFGMINTPTWDNAEEFWQYRSIEKPLPDFRGIGTSADIGH